MPAQLHARPAAGLLMASLILAVTPAQAAGTDTLGQSPPAAALPPASSPDVVLNLLKILVVQHVITQTQADALIKQAQQEAAAARAAPPPAPVARAPLPSSVHVQYVPEIVKDQIRDEVKQEVLQTAKAENWAQPNALPDWISRITFNGDFRLRYEEDLFGSGNFNQLVDFNSINAGSPYDLGPNNTSLPPLLNTTEDRERLRVRGRFGLVADIDDGITAGIRLSTGTDTNPISPNQTLGTDFNKFEITADRAWIKYQPNDMISATAGRFENPFFTSDLVWYGDLSLDGVAASLKAPAIDGIVPFLTFGAFPIENTTFDFPSTSENKIPSRDKWLYAAQLGTDWHVEPAIDWKQGAAFYYYQNLQGEESSPCIVLTSSDSCNTDLTRPGYLSKGNTLFALRNIVQQTGTSTSMPEYFGIASAFQVLEIRERVDMAFYDPVHIIVDGDYAVNTAFDRNKILALSPVNSYGGSIGNEAFMMKLTVGHPEIKKLWDWNLSFEYKYLESDSVVDAFTDSDFHLGGTNAKGYVVIGNLGLGHNLWLQPRWFSTTEVSGPPLAIDVLELDLNAKF